MVPGVDFLATPCLFLHMGVHGWYSSMWVVMDTLAEWPRRRPAKPMGSPRVGSNPTGVDSCCSYDAQIEDEERIQQYTQPGLNWRPPACWAGVIDTRPWVLVSAHSSGQLDFILFTHTLPVGGWAPGGFKQKEKKECLANKQSDEISQNLGGKTICWIGSADCV